MHIASQSSSPLLLGNSNAESSIASASTHGDESSSGKHTNGFASVLDNQVEKKHQHSKASSASDKNSGQHTNEGRDDENTPIASGNNNHAPAELDQLDNSNKESTETDTNKQLALLELDGKLIPLSGNSLPEGFRVDDNTLVNTQQSDSKSAFQFPGNMLTTNSLEESRLIGKPSVDGKNESSVVDRNNSQGNILTGKSNSEFIDNFIEFASKANSREENSAHIQQSSHVQSESSATNLALSSFNGLDKISSTRGGGLTGFNSIAQPLVEAQAGSTEWNNQVGDKLRWMTKANISSAEIKLNPAELGSIEIKISTEDNQTKITFLTASAATKEIIEESLPRLRDLLSESGLQLEQSDVSQRNLSDNGDSEEQNIFAGLKGDDEERIAETQISARKATLGQIDHYV
ncbi:MAG: hypothetical protein COA96_04835 [SAR86 cluster bacterium]|uniref:Flagellar hook-length control protein-like C-terminal domain-containing protein n=1 Tax=SAR86 cluster bacterium TaxID=2030880 RepID=A0A2A5B6A6_9GAMM|nr:MAG: hypothetical protein COA96_04835 [SAR86 cluster bacterium]